MTLRRAIGFLVGLEAVWVLGTTFVLWQGLVIDDPESNGGPMGGYGVLSTATIVGVGLLIAAGVLLRSPQGRGSRWKRLDRVVLATVAVTNGLIALVSIAAAFYEQAGAAIAWVAAAAVASAVLLGAMRLAWRAARPRPTS
jgi:hypothetical protein